MTKQLTRQEVEAVVERFDPHANKCDYCKYDGKVTPFCEYCGCEYPRGVTIGNVLEKIETMKIIPDDGHTYIQRDRFTGQLLELWKDCTTEEDRAKGRTALSRSLQEIIEESGWQLIPAKTTCKNGETNWNIEVLKSPEANALLSFLQEIL